MFLCLFIFFSWLCLECPLCRLEGHIFSYLWNLLPVGGVGPVTCEGFLAGGTFVCVLVDGAGSCLSGGQYSVQ